MGIVFFEETKFLRMNEKLCVKGCRFFTERTISLEQTFKERYIFTEQTMFLNKHLKKLSFLPKEKFY